jgi:leucyl-tRNA synthetase
MVLKDGAKMSKSKGNLVGAIDIAEKYGCNTGRLYTLFAAPPEKDLEWSEQGIEGCARFLNRVYRLIDKHGPRLQSVASDGDAAGEPGTTAKGKLLVRRLHQTLKHVTDDFETRWHFNTSIALIMELVNDLVTQEPLDEDVPPAILKSVLEGVVLMLFPMAPHIAEELWEKLGHSDGVYSQKWPRYRDDLARDEQVEIPVQVNGRVRARITVDVGLREEQLKERAASDSRIAPLIAGKQIARVVVVPSKLVNIVVR